MEVDDNNAPLLQTKLLLGVRDAGKAGRRTAGVANA
jgi:hypothetical protein